MNLITVATMGVVLGMVTACAAESPVRPGMAVTPGTGIPQAGDKLSTGSKSPNAEGEVIIKLKGALSAAERDGKLRNLGLTSVRRLEGINADLARIPAGESVEQAVERLNKEPDVEYAEPNYRVRIQ